MNQDIDCYAICFGANVPSSVPCTFCLFIRPISYPVLCQNSALLK